MPIGAREGSVMNTEEQDEILGVTNYDQDPKHVAPDPTGHVEDSNSIADAPISSFPTA